MIKLFTKKTFFTSIICTFFIISIIAEADSNCNKNFQNNCKIVESLSFVNSDKILSSYPVMCEPIIVDTNIFDLYSSNCRIVDTPEEFSWKDINGLDFTTPAKHQKGCGSCWDFAALGALESVIEIRENCPGLNPDLSEQYVLSCLPYGAHDPGNGCTSGGTPYKAFYWIKDTSPDGNGCNGIIPESCFAYQANDDIPCSDKCEDWEESLVPILSCEESWPGFYNSYVGEVIKSQIYLNGPVAAGMDANQDFIKYGQLNHNPNDYFPYQEVPWQNSLNHIILIVGWKDDPSIGKGGYWICKNSWGPDWGYEGFYNIEYGCLFTGMYISFADYDPLSYDWPPVADAGGIYEGNVGKSIEFDGSNSVDPEGDIVNYTWDFGDGQKGFGVAPIHYYDFEDIYTVTLTVKDNSNQSNSVNTIIGVGGPPIDIDFSGGFGLKLYIKNNADQEIRDLNWNLDLNGFLLSLSPYSGTISDIGADQVFDISFTLLGLGKADLQLNFENIIEERSIFLLGPFVLVKN